MHGVMEHCSIISPALQRQQNTTVNHGQCKAKTGYEISLYYQYLIPPVVLVVVTNYTNRFDKDKTFSWTYVLVIAAAVFTLIALLGQRKANGKEVEAIALYPLGIQLGILSMDDTSTSEIFVPQEFLHREAIVDCVVTELVYSYKVQSAVMLRTRPTDEIENAKAQSLLTDNTATNSGQAGNMSDTFARKRNARERVTGLIRLFTDAEMTYLECLMIRSQINNYLNHSKEAT